MPEANHALLCSGVRSMEVKLQEKDVNGLAHLTQFGEVIIDRTNNHTKCLSVGVHLR